MQKNKLYIILHATSVIVFGTGVVITLFLVPPEGWTHLLLFYSLLCLCSFSVFSLIGMYVRKWFGQRELIGQYMVTASRQAVWLTIILAGALALASRNLLTWLNATFLVLAVVCFESYLIVKNDRKP
ncbi:MAG TPA: hypothetical protein VL306_01520 [Methylomirabilota bacterium]|nr:hypothetical protein [Methylomirabilota bacterium]